MDLDNAIRDYKVNIRKLALKNGVEYDVMLDNWKQKFEEFHNITNQYGFEDDLEEFAKDNPSPFLALTINGSIVIASKPAENDERKVRYQSIKIRTDDSSNVPEIFHAVMNDDVVLKKAITFVKTIETSFIICIKTSDSFNWDEFEEKAANLTQEFTKKFEMIDNETITRRLSELEDEPAE